MDWVAVMRRLIELLGFEDVDGPGFQVNALAEGLRIYPKGYHALECY